jgi:ribonucleoside-diphosphate reductase alpha chain
VIERSLQKNKGNAEQHALDDLAITEKPGSLKSEDIAGTAKASSLKVESIVGVCPDCGGALWHIEGCMVCKSCGYSKCG